MVTRKEAKIGEKWEGGKGSGVMEDGWWVVNDGVCGCVSMELPNTVEGLSKNKGDIIFKR